MEDVYIKVMTCGIMYEWWMPGDKGRIWNPLPALAYSYQKPSRGPPGLTFPFDVWIAINNTYAFIPHALRRDLRFNPGIFGTETSDWGSASSFLLILVPERNETFLHCRESNLGQRVRQWLCFCAKAGELWKKVKYEYITRCRFWKTGKSGRRRRSLLDCSAN